jgi:hypothetical protein
MEIDFTGRANLLRGTNKNTACFGKNGELEKLAKIIKTKSFIQ